MNRTPAQESLRRDRTAMIQALGEMGAKVRGNVVNCPFHGDKHASASIYVGSDGAVRFKCHTVGCEFDGDIFDVREKVAGEPVADQLRELRGDVFERPAVKPPRVFPTIDALLKSVATYTTVEAHYVYSDPALRLPEMIVVRCRSSQGDKSFLQGKPVGGGFVMKAPAKPWPIYNRRRVAEETEVIVVEGEKCVHALHDVGIVATTSPGGAKNAEHADWRALAGKTVYLWPDNDVAGVKYMHDVAAILAKLDDPPMVFWIEPTDFELPLKGDVVEYIEKWGGETKKEKFDSVRCALMVATPFGPSASVRRLIEDTISGKRKAIDWPCASLGNLTNALLPGTVTVVCGDPGASKSFLLLQAARHWHRIGVKFALYQLEADEDGSHLMRALVQESGCAGYLSPRWIEQNPDEARRHEAEHRKFLDAFGGRLTTPPRTPPTMDELAEWVIQQAKDGCRVIAVDPVTAAETSDKPWQDDKRFLLAVQDAMRAYGCSLILVTHPKKGSGKTGGALMDDMAGGAAFARFTQTVMWVRKFEPRKVVRCKTIHGDCNTEINRSVKIAKARLGMGGGLEVGFTFRGDMLFAEQGLIVKEPPKETEAA